MLGAGDRMAGNEMHALGQMRAHLAHDRALDGPDIGHDRPWAKRGRHLLRQLPAYADGRAQHDEIGIVRRLRRRRIDGIRQPQPQRRIAGLCRLRMAGNAARKPAAPDGMAQRRADQPQADQRDALEHGLGHDRPMNSASAATTRRLSSSVPMVMRRQLGSP